MDQLRYNTDKPCSTYWYANHLALERFEASFTVGVCAVEDAIVRSTSTFLANVWSDPWAPLVRAVTSLLMAVEDQVFDGAVDVLPSDITPMSFLAHCEHALAAYDRLCQAGERKYARGNYRHGAPLTEYLDSFFRHLHAHLRGKLVDPETGATHLTCALWNAWQTLNQPKWRDNRLPAVQASPLYTIEDAYARPAAVVVPVGGYDA